ncbi:MAG: hypothetical protein RBT05_00510 [Bacteroidales bacterium]|jgi:hypothetical protein|nr:hypothetical protein [Actinomycetota bacterium]MDX9797320.1 hypothetical protein [Bacteroidales bacterium]
MAKKERLGSDPLKDSPLGWIQDTREESEKKEPGKDKNNDVLTSKRYNVKEPKRLNAKTSVKKRHTIYLTASQSKKLRVYAAANEISISDVIEKLINENI